MLFNSYSFLLAFLPLALAGYFALGRTRAGFAISWLTAASLFFYAWWNPRFVLLLLASIAFNFLLGRALLQLSGAAHPHGRTRVLLSAGVAANLLLLGVFKYADFVVFNISSLAGVSLAPLGLILPLGISFFTFTQIAFLVDAAQGRVESLSPLRYALFVSFFPHLIAGPILHHREMMPQFARADAARPDADNLARGIFIFAIGLAKKLLVADQFSPIADSGFAMADRLDGPAAWATSIAYSIQLYFDFSGYSDMAVGLGLMFNIRLPQNFDSPYRATSIQQFWQRWHMTLSRFLREYLYVPLGGNQGGRLATLRNLFITFLLGGLWHGAAWTFVAWGVLHGTAVVIQRVWSWTGLRLPAGVGWLLTILFVNFAWVYFRASSLAQANAIVASMFGFSPPSSDTDFGKLISEAARSVGGLFGASTPASWMGLLAFACVFAAVLRLPNSIAIEQRFVPSRRTGVLAGVLLAAGMLAMQRTSEFLYFNF